MPSLILASGSPRRIELLRQIVSTYNVAASAVEETGSDLFPEWDLKPLDLPKEYQIPQAAHPTLWAWRKAADVALHLPDTEADSIVVLGADAIVVGPGMLLGKPKDNDDAMRMLQALRGKRHFVVTGRALVKIRDNHAQTLHARATISSVWMRHYSDDELKGYVATGESLDKAGAYALQGLGAKLVSSIEGCYKNVIGLPLCAVRRALVEAGLEVLPYPDGGYCGSLFCPSFLPG